MKRVINLLFAIFVIALIIAVFFIDKNVETMFQNTVKWDNAGYFLLAFILLCICSWEGDTKEISYKRYKIISILIVVITAVLQGIISRWMPVKILADFSLVRESAIEIAQGGSLAGKDYFISFPNNINITVVLSWLYRIFQDWRWIIFCGSLLTNLSVLLISCSVYKISGSTFAALFIEIMGEILLGLTWRAFLPYTDNYGMVFVALMIFVYFTKIPSKYKIPMIIFCGFAGAFIKATVCVVLLAIAIHAWMKNIHGLSDLKDNLRRILLILFCCVICLGVIMKIQTVSRNNIQYEPSSIACNWTYYFMLGQNTQAYGMYNDGDSAGIRFQILQNYSEDKWNQAFVQEALTRIKSRGLIGNIQFYLMKINLAYNDGYFHNMRQFTDEDIDKNCLYSFYLDDASGLYRIGADVMQVLWDTILLLVILDTFLFRKLYSNIDDIFWKVAILGITMYLMIFEVRSKYIYMFLPVYMCYGGVIFNRFRMFFSKVIKLDLLKGVDINGKN
ncbi:MAG: hypothetical protein HDR04_07770 [Lachnospiraceae bacterium]|nr:hypothetical protein [Lachnospiraceae bacterium]